jgi:septal ring factor EnvC (AmiA/AmiB activator)
MIVSLILLATLVSLLLVSVIALFSRLRQQQKIIDEKQNQIKEIMTEIKALLNADIIFGKSVTELNQHVVSLDSKIEQLENRQQNDGSYQHALRILEMGGGKEEIMQSCHLSNAEAELLINLNAYRMATNP